MIDVKAVEHSKVTTVWGTRALAMEKYPKTQRVTVVEKSGDRSKGHKILSDTSLPLVNMKGQTICYSGTNARVAQLFTGSDKKKYLRVYDQKETTELISVDLSEQKKHGVIHGKGSDHFGVFAFSNDGNSILYSAERKTNTSEYFDPDLDWENEEKIIESNVGSKYELVDSWGEDCYEVKQPVLCVIDITTGKVTVLDQMPDTISPSFAIWAPNDEGVVFFGLDNQPFKLGKIYCNNRTGSMYFYELKTARLTLLGTEGIAAESPVFSPDGTKLYYFQRPADGPHRAVAELVSVSWPYDGTAPKVVVPIVTSCSLGEFPGITQLRVTQRCFSTDGKRLVIGMAWNSKLEVVTVNVESGTVSKLTNIEKCVGSWKPLDVHGDTILAVLSAPNMPPTTQLAVLPPVGDEEKIVWTQLSSPHLEKRKQLLNYSWSFVDFRRKGATPYEGILIVPNEGESLPLVVFPHGGPHSVDRAEYIITFSPQNKNWQWPEISLLLNSGFAVLTVNYHGSIGFGDDFVRSLPGKCGTLDVKDVEGMHATETVLVNESRLSRNKVVIYGGSHGGFIVSHLIGQYPNFYKACATRNPALNLLAMFEISDIPDWTAFEGCGVLPDWTKTLSEEQQKLMFGNSPIAHVDKVVTPYLLLIGEKDLRCTPHYRAFLRNLQARGVPNKVLSYPSSNHPLSEMEVEADRSINMLRWFNEHIY